MTADVQAEPAAERVSYWLVPAEPDKFRLQRMIFALARRFDAPRFEPHVTIYSGPHAAQDGVAEILAAATRGISEITLKVAGVAHSEEFTKTLSLQFASDERLLNLSHELKRLSGAPANYDLNPHLSLVYAPLAPDVKAALAGDLMYPASIHFNFVKAIVGTSRTQTRQDIEAWRVVAERRLAEQ